MRVTHGSIQPEFASYRYIFINQCSNGSDVFLSTQLACTFKLKVADLIFYSVIFLGQRPN